MKFSVGRSSTLGFKLSPKGYRGQSHDFSALTDGSNRDFTLPFDDQFIKEFPVKYKNPVNDIVSKALEKEIFIEPCSKNDSCDMFMLSFTEKKSKAHIDYLTDFLSQY